MVTDSRFVNTLLDGQHLSELDSIKQHHGIKANSDTIRYLIRQEARRIQSDSGPGSVKAILAGYLAGQVTAEEALTALTVHSELMPASRGPDRRI